MSYYKDELKKMGAAKNITVKFYASKCEIKELNVNLESIRDIKNFLSRLERKLIKEQIIDNAKKLSERDSL